jgi:hypothetical protein
MGVGFTVGALALWASACTASEANDAPGTKAPSERTALYGLPTVRPPTCANLTNVASWCTKG